MVGTLCSSGQAIVKAGIGVSASVPATAWDEFIEEAEGYLNALTKYDLVTNWAASSGQAVSPMLTEYCARAAAVQGVQYDMSGYTSRVEAEDIINVHIYEMAKINAVLAKADVQDFMGV